MGKIILEDIELYAWHGHLPEEKKIGSRFRIHLDMEVELSEACTTDDLKDTFDYSEAYSIVCEEMKVPSSLIEHVANRILERLLNASPRVLEARIQLSKMNPPFGGEVKAVTVELSKKRNEL